MRRGLSLDCEAQTTSPTSLFSVKLDSSLTTLLYSKLAYVRISTRQSRAQVVAMRGSTGVVYSYVQPRLNYLAVNSFQFCKNDFFLTKKGICLSRFVQLLAVLCVVNCLLGPKLVLCAKWATEEDNLQLFITCLLERVTAQPDGLAVIPSHRASTSWLQSCCLLYTSPSPRDS